MGGACHFQVTQIVAQLDMAVADSSWLHAKFLKPLVPSRALLESGAEEYELAREVMGDFRMTSCLSRLHPERQGRRRSEGSARRLTQGQSGRRRSAAQRRRHAARPGEKREVPRDPVVEEPNCGLLWGLMPSNRQDEGVSLWGGSTDNHVVGQLATNRAAAADRLDGANWGCRTLLGVGL